jgi:hypothetical protein
MKRTALGLFLTVVIVGAAWAQSKPVPVGIKKFTNCATTGSSAQVLANGDYTMTVLDERTTVCFGSVCDGGVGSDFPSGYGQQLRLNGADGGTPVACLSAGATGDVHFLPMVK